MTNNLEPSVGDQLRYAQFIKGIERLSHDELKEVVTELARWPWCCSLPLFGGPPMRPLKILEVWMQRPDGLNERQILAAQALASGCSWRDAHVEPSARGDDSCMA